MMKSKTKIIIGFVLVFAFLALMGFSSQITSIPPPQEEPGNGGTPRPMDTGILPPQEPGNGGTPRPMDTGTPIEILPFRDPGNGGNPQSPDPDRPIEIKSIDFGQFLLNPDIYVDPGNGGTPYPPPPSEDPTYKP
jgi:hypothetical protein